jgi:hypothetical protein
LSDRDAFIQSAEAMQRPEDVFRETNAAMTGLLDRLSSKN